jgi:arsenate reductase
VRSVLFLGIGNTSATIMAEALLNHLGNGNCRAWSAGSSPEGSVHPRTIETLKRHGINPGTPVSESWNNYSTRKFDLIVSLRGCLIEENWPLFPDRPQIQHWELPRLPNSLGSSAEAAAFDAVFYVLKKHIEQLVLTEFSGSEKEELKSSLSAHLGLLANTHFTKTGSPDGR